MQPEGFEGAGFFELPVVEAQVHSDGHFELDVGVLIITVNNGWSRKL